ncbi:leucine-rich repeat domain-containing protein [Stieleria varia]|uniref:Leucine Rich repeats (2 copies) n=1 Tax=Stieleria varia TaxID=2528005 RepID=A0A5C6BBD5_9BACT|nr:hypothetical protein [Stieleria varia]TWU08566.1 hypothetical protein Pla52n_11490 [Stieleria varia]
MKTVFNTFRFPAIPIVLTLACVTTFADSPTGQRLNELDAKVKEVAGEIVDLKINCDQMTDADYQLVARLQTLKSISFDGKSMTDQQLVLLSGLSQLESFQINGTRLTDDGYKHFAAFQNLQRLSLFHPSRDVDAFTGAGLAHLKALPKLERLTFAGATAGDAAFQAVGQLTQLKEFSQWHNTESPAAIKHLTQLPLTKLKMGQRLPDWKGSRPPSLTDATLSEIARMPNLETLELQEARLTYAGLIQLKSVSSLKTLKLKWVDVTESDVARLRVDCPNIEIQWEPLTAEEEESLLTKKLKL